MNFASTVYRLAIVQIKINNLPSQSIRTTSYNKYFCRINIFILAKQKSLTFNYRTTINRSLIQHNKHSLLDQKKKKKKLQILAAHLNVSVSLSSQVTSRAGYAAARRLQRVPRRKAQRPRRPDP